MNYFIRAMTKLFRGGFDIQEAGSIHGANRKTEDKEVLKNSFDLIIY